ncbi:hypothetical protein D3C80_1384570 [compost metagenome]
MQSQPTNIASAVAGVGAGWLMTAGATVLALPAAPLVAVVAVSFVAGVLVQWVIVKTGLDKTVSDALKIEDDE